MKMFTPGSSLELAARNSLLQRSLREPGLNFPIESEYPIVLSTNGNQFSFCFKEGTELVAHANLWPRSVTCKITNQKWNIGLIGNVATDERFRGRGIMTGVLDNLKAAATANDLTMLILWSDLLEFYQKQSFRSFSEEIRYIFNVDSLAGLPAAGTNFIKFEKNRIYDDTLRTFLNLRPQTNPSVERTIAEFQAMLSIPLLQIYCSTSASGKVLAYAVKGKGADMASVIHEWGGVSPEDVLQLVNFMLQDARQDAVMLLTPVALPHPFHLNFAEKAVLKESHPMALVWTNPLHAEKVESLSGLFIWGLDSI